MISCWIPAPHEGMTAGMAGSASAVPAAGELIAMTDPLRLAVASYLARFKGQTRLHTESDLRCYLDWCTAHRLPPLTATRAHVELFVRWMQETRTLKPSTVSRRVSVVAGFYRTAVIDGILPTSPAEYVRRPHVSNESPTLGLTHLQFEALLVAARQSSNVNDFALVSMLGLLGLRIFEATGADVTDLGEEHGHGCCGCLARATRPCWSHCRLQSPGRSSAPSVDVASGRCCGAAPVPGWTATPPPAGCRSSPTDAVCRSGRSTRTCSGTRS